MSRHAKHRSYVFTINNYDQSDLDAVESLRGEARYCCYAPERGDSGTPHLQGYVHFRNQRSRNGVSRLLPRAWIEPANGSSDDNRQYIFGPYERGDKNKPANPDAVEFGELPRQGARSDIEQVKELVHQGHGMRRIAPVCNSYQAIKCGEQLLKWGERKRDFKPTVKWFWGSTGTGKTRTALEECKQLAAAAEGITDLTDYTTDEIYMSMDSCKWWEGYDAHKYVIIDDFRGDFCKFTYLLRLLDRYEYRLENKGGSRQFLATHIYITSCSRPQDCYQQTTEKMDQLLRRIDEVRHFSPVVYNPAVSDVEFISVEDVIPHIV